MKTTDKILIIVFVFLAIYTAVVLWLFSCLGVEPVVLTGCVFSACIGELGICWRIWKRKDLRQQRKWSKEDAAEAERKTKEEQSE